MVRKPTSRNQLKKAIEKSDQRFWVEDIQELQLSSGGGLARLEGAESAEFIVGQMLGYSDRLRETLARVPHDIVVRVSFADGPGSVDDRLDDLLSAIQAHLVSPSTESRCGPFAVRRADLRSVAKPGNDRGVEPRVDPDLPWKQFLPKFSERMQVYREAWREELQNHLRRVMKKEGFGSKAAKASGANFLRVNHLGSLLAPNMKGLGFAVRCVCGSSAPADLSYRSRDRSRGFAYRHYDESGEQIIEHVAGDELADIEIIDVLEADAEVALKPFAHGFLVKQVYGCGTDYATAFHLMRSAARTTAGDTVRSAFQAYLDHLREQLLKSATRIGDAHFGSLEANRAFAASLNDLLDELGLRLETPGGPATLVVNKQPAGRAEGRFRYALTSQGHRGSHPDLPELRLIPRPRRKRSLTTRP